jgi:hypothetical protein
MNAKASLSGKNPRGDAGDRKGCEGGGAWGVVWLACGECWACQTSVNSKAETVEELQARRKNLHMGMVNLAREDLSLSLQAAVDTHKVTPHSPSCANGF